MAGAVEQGFGNPSEDEPEDNTPTFNPVHVRTDAWHGETIGMYDMPAMRVLDVISTPGILQLVKLAELFKLSINDPDRLDAFNLLTFKEFSVALDQWVEKSREGVTKMDFDL